ncbi:flagellar biosynthesis protein FlhF [Salinicola rhizosphaerae]|uniref:Flagellar biosynthesis protein FlhF n=1 Tax=Salinicola rhizosphaerae TaxID=1443141 RepID=A0ABQ3DYD4_9GAMM|nr:flagellar biosynthesis protein FlhF [Salinicola rhizosphaerae]GHB16614.1 hypothetical protein GCM10009038_13990 [Salinicola rhizosphaerae]
MGVERFIASNSREAMRQVRAKLGEEVLILSNRTVEGGVEIIAMAEQEHEAALSTLTAQSAPAASDTSPVAPASTSASAASSNAAQTLPDAPAAWQAFQQQLLDNVRSLLQSRDDSPAETASRYAALRQRLIRAGFSATLTDEIVQDPPEELRDVSADSPAALAWLRRQLRARLSLLDDEEALFADGGVFALVGPTGVGKTTTTAKLASRYVMRHGAKDVALVTTDSYRIGAAEQLRIYARLLGVDVHALDADGNLGDLLARLTQPRRALLSRASAKRLTVIDTVGMSQRDQRLVGEIARLAEGPAPVRRVLVLNAAAHGDTLAQVIESWQRASSEAGEPLWGCILTKLDEAARLGGVLDVVMRHRLKLCYLSRGQRVPEDLEPIDADRLLDEALSLADASDFVGDSDRDVSPHQARQQALSRGVLRQSDALATTLATLRQHNLGMTLLEQTWARARRHDASQRDFARLMADTTQQQLLASSDSAHALYWSKTSNVSGADRAMPVITLDHQGLPQPLAWPRHRLPAGRPEQLEWAEKLGASWHLMAQLPALAELERLDNHGRGWLSSVAATRRVRHGGEWLPLSQVIELGETLPARELMHHGKRATLNLTRIETTLCEKRHAEPALAVVAWSGEIRDRDDGRRLARRYWLSSARAGLDVASRLTQAVAVESLPALTRQADTLLDARGLIEHERAERWQLAASLAALALRLSLEEADWAMDVRARLSGIAQRRCGRRPKALLEAIMDTLSAHQALSRHDERETLSEAA